MNVAFLMVKCAKAQTLTDEEKKTQYDPADEVDMDLIAKEYFESKTGLN